jgi:hypothetical protein
MKTLILDDDTSHHSGAPRMTPQPLGAARSTTQETHA